jgi:hypothetical protein
MSRDHAQLGAELMSKYDLITIGGTMARLAIMYWGVRSLGWVFGPLGDKLDPQGG